MKKLTNKNLEELVKTMLRVDKMAMKKTPLLSLFIAFFITSINLFSQEKKYYSEESLERMKYRNGSLLMATGVFDTILIKNKIYYFKDDPVFFIDGARAIMYDKVMHLMGLPNDDGYRMLWEVKKRNYL